jgi:hypothetical protein
MSFPRINRHSRLYPNTNHNARLVPLLVLALALGLAVMAAMSFAAPAVSAQSAPAKIAPDIAAHPEWPKANPADVDTIEDTVHAFFSAISAPAGGKLDRNRLQSLFVPQGRIAVGLPARGTHAADILFMSLDEYADRSDAATAKAGFFDRNPANQVERFGVMAHVYAFYESRSNPQDAKPMARGIKSIELVNSQNRWYIVQVYWDSERADNPVPESYQHDGSW